MREAAKLFLGYHDFKTFSAKDASKNSNGKNKLTRRTITKFSIEEIPINLYSNFSMPTFGLNRKAIYKCYDIYVEAPGFLYNQVGSILIYPPNIRKQ